MQNIAPDIFRQRLLIEGYYTIDMTSEVVEKFLTSLADRLGLRTYGSPIVFSPESGMGKETNQGFDAFGSGKLTFDRWLSDVPADIRAETYDQIARFLILDKLTIRALRI